MWLAAPDTGMSAFTHTIREKRKGKTAVSLSSAIFLETHPFKVKQYTYMYV